MIRNMLKGAIPKKSIHSSSESRKKLVGEFTEMFWTQRKDKFILKNSKDLKQKLFVKRDNESVGLY